MVGCDIQLALQQRAKLADLYYTRKIGAEGDANKPVPSRARVISSVAKTLSCWSPISCNAEAFVARAS